MSELITVQVGQCGNQIGQAFWPHILKDYGLIGGSGLNKKSRADNYYDSFFYNPRQVSFSSLDDMKQHNIKARALLIDMEDSVVERFHSCKLQYLFDKSCTLTSYPGSGNNWAVGHLTHGREQRETFLNMLQTSVERCDSLSGFLSMFSLSGGTGSGLGSAIVELLHEEYPKTNRYVCCVHPGENQDVVTAPYNIALCLSKLKEHATCVFPMDNQVLLDISSRLFISKDMKFWKPYQNMNTLIVKFLLNITSGARFAGVCDFNMDDLSMNLVPYPGLHFLAGSMSPISFVKEEDIPVNQRHTNLVVELWSKSNQLMSVAPTKGLVNSIAVLARGDFSTGILKTFSSKIQSRLHWSSWSNQDTKIVHCPKAPYDHPKSLTCLSNTDMMGHFFADTLVKFYRLYKKKAHVHHYTAVNGFEDSFLSSVRNLRDIVDTYEENRRL